MTVMVGLNFVIAAVLGFTAALCLGASMGMRGNRPLAWFGAGLACGAIQTLALTMIKGGGYELAAAVLAPMGYLCAALGIHAMTPKSSPHPLVIASTIGLSIAALLLVVLQAPFFWQAVMMRLACAPPCIDGVMQMVRRRKPGWLDWMIVAGLSAIATFAIIRLPILLFYFGPEVTHLGFKLSVMEIVVLSVSGLLVPPVIVLLVARNIADTIANYQRQSERDGLTGLYNRRAFDSMAGTPEVTGGAVIFCDLDNFKSINDRFGHQAGDEVIRAFADVIAGPGYAVGRLGGEEFAVLLPGHGAHTAVDLAEMFRSRFASTRHANLPVGTFVTASFGVAVYGAGVAPAHAFGQADLALYAAKNEGRNRVISAPEPLSLDRPRRVA